MKLLFVLPEFGPDITGGIATYYRHLLPELALHGHAVHVVLANANPARALESAPGLTVSRVDAKSVAAEFRSLDALAAVPELQRRLARAWAAWRVAGEGTEFDVVEATDYGTLFAPWLAQPSRPPVQVQLHGSNGQLLTHDPIAGEELQACVTRLMEASLLGHAEELQSYGRANACEWTRLLGREVNHLWPAWRPASQTQPAALPAGVEGLVAGRVQSWKGPAVLCEALRRLGPGAPTIAWVGGDTYFRRNGRWTGEHLAAAYPDVWGRKVVPLGRRTPRETAALQAAARFVVVPSTWDVFNLSVVEGMGHGKVVICSDGAGAAELIREGETGFRFPAGDAAALADRLRRTRELSEAEHLRMGEAARAAVVVELDPTRIAGQRAARYEALAKVKTGANRQDLTVLAGFGEPIEDPLAFLDRLPLRRLVRGLIRQGMGRLWKMLGR
jgi:glycosyltransferase involved in cell wall biosynthesis